MHHVIKSKLRLTKFLKRIQSIQIATCSENRKNWNRKFWMVIFFNSSGHAMTFKYFMYENISSKNNLMIQWKYEATQVYRWFSLSSFKLLSLGELFLYTVAPVIVKTFLLHSTTSSANAYCYCKVLEI